MVDSGSLLAMRAFTEGGVHEQGWPWNRLLYGPVVDFLERAGARAVVLDFDFSGASPRDEFLEDSASLAAVLRSHPLAWLGVNLKKHPRLEELPESSRLRAHTERAREVLRRMAVPVREEVELPFERGRFDTAQVPYGPLRKPGVARGLGVLNGAREPGDTVRSIPLLFRVEGELVPSLSLAVARDVLGADALRVGEDGDLRLDGHEVPLDAQGRMGLCWYGPQGTFRTRPIHWTIKVALAAHERRVARDGIEPQYWASLGWSERISEDEVRAHRDLFRDKIVLVGASAPELGDVFTNPWSETFPGVEVHATALGNLLRGHHLRRLGGPARIAVLALLALLGALLPVLAGGERRGLAVFLALAVAWLLALSFAFRQEVLWLGAVTPLGTLGLAYGGAVFVHYLQTGQLKRRLRTTFEHVLQPQLVEHLLADPHRLALGGETRELTVLFTDLQNSTALSERLDPGRWVERLNRYFSEATELLVAHRAYLDKYIGDGLMAVWGAPVPDPDHAVHACLAVVDLRERLQEVQREIHELHGVELVTRIGLNTGDMVVGMVGSDRLAHYTVLGDAVVVASRLEGANKFYGTTALVGDATYRSAKDAVVAREIDLVVLKGKTRPIRVWEPLARREASDAGLEARLEAWNEALAAYREGRWEDAVRAADACLRLRPDDAAAARLAARCRQHAEAPPPGWEGVTVLASK